MERRYIVVKLNAGNDRNGNPRRGWLVYLDTQDTPLLGWIEEDYNGDSHVYRAIPAAEYIVGTSTLNGIDDWRPFRDSGRVRVVCSLSVPLSEVREARRRSFSLSRSEV